jgi:GT2 family glycosyltransferase
VKLSVVIPCYNAHATILTVIEAVRKSPYADKEIIVVDDCSRDGTRELLQKEVAPPVRKCFITIRIEVRVPPCARASLQPAATSLLFRTPTWNTIHSSIRF